MEKDYFTSALPFRVKGSVPALPVFGDSFADFTDAFLKWSELTGKNLYSRAEADSSTYDYGFDTLSYSHSVSLPTALTTAGKFTVNNAFINGISEGNLTTSNSDMTEANYNSYRNNWIEAMNSNTINAGTLTSVNISQLRLIVQIQRWLELNARAGTRYTEFLRAHFSVAPRDERLDRAEFIGSTSQSIVVSVV